MSVTGSAGWWRRLRERGVVRVAASYAVIAWLVLQIADVILEPWDVAPWIKRAPLVVVLIGFPIALALAWFLELGERGVTVDALPTGSPRPAVHGLRRYADVAVISVLAAIVGFFVIREAGWFGQSLRGSPAVESSSLAVLPFTNAGAASDQYLSEGLGDELRNQFSRLRSLSVTSRSSSMAFQGQSLDSVSIAQKLAVATLLEGSVSRSAGRIQVAVQLVSGRTGRILWGELYDRPDRDLLAVQRDIAAAVVATVLPRFAPDATVAPPPTENAVAYDLYLLGRQRLRESERAELSDDMAAASALSSEAKERFRSAIAADPKFAQAHANLAGAMLANGYQVAGLSGQAEVESDVMSEISLALELDPRNSTAYFVKGVLLRGAGRPGGGEAYRRAAELDPGSSDAISALVSFELSQGHLAESLRLALRARELDPMELKHHMVLMVSEGMLGRRADVRSTVERMQRQFPGEPDAAMIACRSLWIVGAHDEALVCALETLAEFPGDSGIVGNENALAGDAAESMGDDRLAVRFFDRAAAAGEPSGELDASRLRRDPQALRRIARAALARKLGPQDWDTCAALALGGLVDEAIEVCERCQLGGLVERESNQLPDAMFGIAQFIAVLRARGRAEQADQMLPALLEMSATLIEHGGRWHRYRLLRAEALALAGRNDEALDEVGQAVDGAGSPFGVHLIERDPALQSLAGDARLQMLVKRLRARQAEIRSGLPGLFRQHGLAWPPA